jgi:integrase
VSRPKLVGDKDRLIPNKLRVKVLKYLAKQSPKAPDQVHRVGIALLLADQAGLRAQEICNLLVSQCDLETEPYRLLIRGAKHRAKDHVDEQPIGQELRDQLVAWLELVPAENHVLTRRSKSYTRQHLHRLVKLVHRACGVPEIYNVHSWRHGYGTRVYKQTKDLVLTQRLLRHRSTKPTERYVHMAEGDERIADVLGGIGS